MSSSLVIINSILGKIILIISIFFCCGISAVVFAAGENSSNLHLVVKKGSQVSQGSDAASRAGRFAVNDGFR